MPQNNVVWVSVPVVDLPRAKEFYAHVTGRPVVGMPGMEDQVATVMGEPDVMSVSIDLSPGTPGVDGPVPYLNSFGDINAMVERVKEAGGQVLSEPQNMGDMVGWIAFFLDSEGNKIGIQQPA